ncbi:HNH endonuclease [Arthrobacter phage Isolde]|uniref:HNH endonuclease n=1 Tax=Arthrobacter phage Isolde TaxID=2419610 RepID=A0A3G3M4W1_9CAUD|nr:HNH endonuclease [Arthrobacter phage Isolde]AYR01048.1 HNH endonuclease [Arthrobacter phage Isolde]
MAIVGKDDHMQDPTCSIPSCESPLLRQGWCSKHYWRWYRHGDPEHHTNPHYQTAAEALQHRVKPEGDHILWTGTVTSTGYGSLRDRGKMRSTHIVAYELAHGPIPEGMEVDHRCLTPLCVNVQHLRLVTHKQNREHLPGAYRSSKSGVRGVWWAKRHKAWEASVRHDGRSYWVGYFDRLEDAAEAVKQKRNELFTHNDLDRQ